MFKIDRRNVKICEPDRINPVPAPKDAGAGVSATPTKAEMAQNPEKKEPAYTGPAAEEIIAAAKIQAKGIVSRAEAEAVAAAEAAAESIISQATAEAQARAEEITAAAVAEAEAAAGEIMESARQAGHDEGVKAAQEEMRLAREELEAQAARRIEELEAETLRLRQELEAETLSQREALAADLKTLSDGLSAGQEEMQAALEQNAVTLALDIARKIMGAAIEWESDAYTSLIKTALKHMKRDGKLVIRLSQADYERLFPEGSASFILGDTTVTATVEPGPAMMPGDCVIESEAERVDAGMGSQLKLVQIAFRKAGDGQ